MKNKFLLILTGILILSVISGLYLVKAADSTWPAFNSCCEKTINDAWCQNTDEKSCDTSVDPTTKSAYRKTPTSCDATSYCKLGCCVDSDEGLCMENTPQKVCQISTGTWLDDAQCNVAQCKLGCCILGDQASFVTQTRCKKLSALYGLTTNFNNAVTDEVKCVMMAYSQDKGACVYEIENQRTCKFTTRADCESIQGSQTGENSTSVDFYKDYLCSADELATNCGPTTDTMCVSGKDEVYFKDSCGNQANIYDANKVYSKSSSYWQKVVSKSDTCGGTNPKGGNINSKTCGNCAYLEGSICGKGTATYGENICKDLNCYNTKNGNNYKNGESWCEYTGETGNGLDEVGSRQFRHVCVHGEETIEPCADFRNEVCIADKISTSSGEFREAACRVNRWQDCIDQVTEEKCLNSDKRDCYWTAGLAYDGAGTTANNASATSVGETDTTGNTGIINGTGICLPDVPPGLKFWDEGDATKICSLGNSKQTVGYETNIFGTKKCKTNCEVLETKWLEKMNGVCSSLGDCGAKNNFVGRYTDDGVLWKSNGKLLNWDGTSQ